MESEVERAAESTGKQDNEKKQKRRAQQRFEQIMGMKPRFAETK